MSIAVDFEKKTPADILALPQRMLGKTGELVPILGLGTAPGGMGMEDEPRWPSSNRPLIWA